MPKFNVHLYREVRFLIRDVEAATMEEAIAKSQDRAVMEQSPQGQADLVDDCEGIFHAALVDVEGDEEFENSICFDFLPDGTLKSGVEL